MKEDDMNQKQDETINQFPPRSSEYPASNKLKWKLMVTVIVTMMVLTIGSLTYYNWEKITGAWQQLFKVEKAVEIIDDDHDQAVQTFEAIADKKSKTEIVDKEIDFEVVHLKNDINIPLVEINKHEQNYKDQVITFVNQDTIMQGVAVKKDFYYEVPISDIGNNNYIELIISHSSLLDPKQSTLTITIDNIPIKSIFLTDENKNFAKIRLPLDKEFLKAGFHKITLNSYNVISNDICLDEKNPANWVKIHSSSHAYIDSKELWARKDLLKDFPYPFVQTGTPLGIHGFIVIPDEPSKQIINAALTLSGYLSSFTIEQAGYPVITESDWMEKQEFKHIIAIGNLNSWNGYMNKIILDNHIQAKENELTLDNFILIKDELKQLLLVSGLTDEEILNKIKILSNKHLEEQLSGNSLKVTNTPQPSVEKVRETTLESIGFEDILLDSKVSKTQTQVFAVPSYGMIKDGSHLDLAIKASPAVIQGETGILEKLEKATESKESAFTVNINNIPYGVSFYELKETIDENGFYHFKIPLSNQLLVDNRSLEISFQSNLSSEQIGCIEEANNQWIFIDNKSPINLKYEQINEFNFKHWPAPYVNHSESKNIAIIIPEQINQQLLTQLSNLYSHILRQSENNLEFTIINAKPNKQEQELLENSHVIIVGNLLSFPFLQDKLNKSFIDFHDNQIDLSKYNLIYETSDYIAWTEPSLWNPKKVMTVLFNLKENDTFLHQDLLDYLLNQTEAVDLVVRNKSGAIFAGNINTSLVDALTETENGKKLPIAAIVGFFMIIAIGMAIFIYFFRKSKR